MNALEVTWIPDDMIKPPGPKMVVCVEPFMGFYFRINSESHFEPCVAITKEPHHKFLRHDSYIEVSILDLDDYVIEQALKKTGVIGKVSTTICDPLIDALGYAAGSRPDRNGIRAVLEKIK